MLLQTSYTETITIEIMLMEAQREKSLFTRKLQLSDM